MADPYRISEPTDSSVPTTEPAHPAAERRSVLRPILWLVLIVSAAANAVTSALNVNLFVSAGFGLVVLGCIVALVTGHYRNR
ncbi:hypothetical protein [Actinoplanes sp. DH11]|uniref:hypothetical protein n=1 Tax=Actinoplanes sp. DH11 TaxID=2857011 RepID=UPI001E624C07|nr:hypothetical protein [Actinoplanes sp. DH11]